MKYIKWSSRLVNSDGTLKFDTDIDSLIICKQSNYRLFTQFDSYPDFCEYQITETLFEERCFYEVIIGNTFQKPYFDLDIPFREISSNEGLNFEDAKILVLQLVDAIRKVYDKIKYEDIMVFSSNSNNNVKDLISDYYNKTIIPKTTPKKISYHIIVDNWYLLNNEENEAFCNKILEYISKNKNFIDNKVYKKIQQFRLYKSHKYKSDRVKELDPISKWICPIKPISDNHLFSMIIGGSLITNTSYCSPLPSFKKVTIIYNEKIKNTNISDKKIKEAIELYSKKEGYKSLNDKEFPFKFQQCISIFIILKRLAPSMCKICNRIHESENPYLFIKKNNVFFNCRRSNRSLLVGSLKNKRNYKKILSIKDINFNMFD
jgi:hypothetical protein